MKERNEINAARCKQQMSDWKEINLFISLKSEGRLGLLFFLVGYGRCSAMGSAEKKDKPQQAQPPQFFSSFL